MKSNDAIATFQVEIQTGLEHVFLIQAFSCNESKKTQHMENDKSNEFICNFISPQTARIIFKARLRVFDIKVNFKNKCIPDLSCAICKEGRETLEHILQCPRFSELAIGMTSSFY